MTIRQVKEKIEKLADQIDGYLMELERSGKDNTDKYETLLYISGGLHELVEIDRILMMERKMKKRISIEEFKRNDRICIHCQTEEEAIKLHKLMNWIKDDPTFDTGWAIIKEQTCYKNDRSALFKIDVKEAGLKMYEFYQIDSK